MKNYKKRFLSVNGKKHKTYFDSQKIMGNTEFRKFHYSYALSRVNKNINYIHEQEFHKIFYASDVDFCQKLVLHDFKIWKS